MHILLSSEETLYQVSTHAFSAKGRAEQISAELFYPTKRSLPKKQAQEQTGYIATAAQAAYASLNKLDWTKTFYGYVELTPNTQDLINFDGNSSGLGYALALALEWRKQLNKTIDYDVEVFATGEIHSSGAVTEIGHLETKITAACNFMEEKYKAEQQVENQTPENQVKHPFVIFYPNANQDDVTPELQTRVAELEGKLCPVERLQSALTELLGNAYDGDAEGRWEPFKGLLSFNYEDSLRFFGRERALAKLSNDFNEAEGLLVVTGVSGSGKSSLIKAGLIPQINQKLPEGHTLDWLISTPKAHKTIESILLELLNTLDKYWPISNDTTNEKDAEIEELANTAIQSPELLIDTIKQAQLSQPNKRVFYYIDQYEDIFNHQDISREQAQQLAPLLASLAKQIPNLNIVISIRSEYEGILGKYGSVSHVNPELNASEWGDIVYKQATSFGLRYEEGLEKCIVNEASSIQHALPALEYLLEQLYKKAKKADKNARVLTHEHYEQLKGIKGVIAARAEEVIAKHPMQAHAFFEYFVGLNSENKPYAQSVNTDEAKQDSEALYDLIQAFVDAQLVVDCSTETEKCVKLAHDTLFNFDNHDSAWTALKEWFEESQVYLKWLNVISGGFMRWIELSTNKKSLNADGKNNQLSVFLLNEHDLSIGLGFQQQNSIQQPKVREYIAQSQKHKEVLLKQKNKKQRLVILFVSVFLLIAVVAGFIAYKKEFEARELTKEAIIKKNEALLAQSKYLMDIAKSKLKEGEYDTALLLSLNALPGEYGGDRPDLEDYSVLNDSIGALEGLNVIRITDTYQFRRVLELDPVLERIYFSQFNLSKGELALKAFEFNSNSILNVQVSLDSEVMQLEISKSGLLGVRTHNKLVVLNPLENDEVLYEYNGETEHFDFSKNGTYGTIINKKKLIVINLELKKVIASYSIEPNARTVNFIDGSKHVVIRFPFKIIRLNVFTGKSEELAKTLYDGEDPDVEEFPTDAYRGFEINPARDIAFYYGRFNYDLRHKEANLIPLSVNKSVSSGKNVRNNSLVFSPSGKYINLIRNKKIVIFEVHQDLSYSRFSEIPSRNGDYINFSKFVSNDTLIAVTGNSLSLWKISKGNNEHLSEYKIPSGRKIVYAGTYEKTNTLYALADDGKLYFFKMKAKFEHHPEHKKFDKLFSLYKNVTLGSFNFKYLGEEFKYGIESYDLTIDGVESSVHWQITNEDSQQKILEVTSNNNLSTIVMSNKKDEVLIASKNISENDHELEFVPLNEKKGNWSIPKQQFTVIKYSLVHNKIISTFSFPVTSLTDGHHMSSIKSWTIEGDYLLGNLNQPENANIEKVGLSVFSLNNKKLQCNLPGYDYFDIALIDSDYYWFEQALAFEKIDMKSCKKTFSIPKENDAEHFLSKSGYHACIKSGNVIVRNLTKNELIKEFYCDIECQYIWFSDDGKYIVATTGVDKDFKENYLLAWSLTDFKQIMKYSFTGRFLEFDVEIFDYWIDDLISLITYDSQGYPLLGNYLISLRSQKVLKTDVYEPITKFKEYRVERRPSMKKGKLPIYHKVIDSTLEHLPMGRKCLTAIERSLFHLPQLTPSEIAIRGCL